MPNSVPEFWENSLDRIRTMMDSVKKGKVRVLTTSAGGRDIYLVEYGEKQDMKRKANYSSACAYGDLSVYADKTEDIKPVVLLVAGTHGGEVEGITAVLNMIQVLETGKDLRGKEWKFISEIKDNYRILLIPCFNPDGRARVPFNIVTEVSEEEVLYYKHGTWKDGTLIKFRESYRAHPVLNDVEFLAGYYNDNGINLSIDNFFAPMAEENKSLMKLVDQEVPDFVVFLHTGCHRHGKLLPQAYLPQFIDEKIHRFDKRLEERFKEAGFKYYSLEEHEGYQTGKKLYPPQPFWVTEAIHHSCGAISVTYESNEAVDDKDNEYSLDNILDCHFILFEEIFRFVPEDGPRVYR